jgi:hypothetical protein
MGTQLLSLKLPHQIYSIEVDPLLQNRKERWKRDPQKGYNCLAETRIMYTLISFIFRIMYKCFQTYNKMKWSLCLNTCLPLYSHLFSYS